MIAGMNRDYLDQQWRDIRKLGRADFVWRRRMNTTYLPSAAALAVVIYIRADGWTLYSTLFFCLAGGGAMFLLCLTFARGEWDLREDQFRKLCEERKEPYLRIE